MSRKRRYLATSVLEEAKDRIRHLYDVFDTLVMMFSGGKDSLVTMHLIKEVAEEIGAGPVNVVFRDEELIPDSVIDLVDHYRQQPWIRMLWYALPLRSTRFILGNVLPYIQWDPAREHVREIPAWAITDVGDPPGTVYSQFDMDYIVAKNYRGKIAAVTGIRASESLVRYRASVNKLNENYITASDSGSRHQSNSYAVRAPNVMLAKPIYDWEEDDVLQFIWERGLRYAPAYDAQHLAGVGLRVATPLVAESAIRALHKLRQTEPKLYAGVIAIWPDTILQERYYRDLDLKALQVRFGQSLEGVREWAMQNLTDGPMLELALKRLDAIVKLARHDPDAWPADWVLRQFMAGAFKRQIQPRKPKVAA